MASLTLPTPLELLDIVRLDDHVALVTGGTQGIGRSICMGFATQGATVAAGYTGDRDSAVALQRELEERAVPASVHPADVGSAKDCHRFVEEVVATHGRIDILVNNAGTTSGKAVLDMSGPEWDEIIAVNLSGAFFMSRSALGHMAERGSGRIVNISPVPARTGDPAGVDYAATRSGLSALTDTLAREAAEVLEQGGKLHEHSIGITVNAVAPGFIAGDAFEQPDGAGEIRARIPVRRLGRPEEVARVVRFLCSDLSAYITGQVWGVDGGLTA